MGPNHVSALLSFLELSYETTNATERENMRGNRLPYANFFLIFPRQQVDRIRFPASKSTCLGHGHPHGH